MPAARPMRFSLDSVGLLGQGVGKFAQRLAPLGIFGLFRGIATLARALSKSGCILAHQSQNSLEVGAFPAWKDRAEQRCAHCNPCDKASEAPRRGS